MQPAITVTLQIAMLSLALAGIAIVLRRTVAATRLLTAGIAVTVMVAFLLEYAKGPDFEDATVAIGIAAALGIALAILAGRMRVALLLAGLAVAAILLPSLLWPRLRGVLHMLARHRLILLTVALAPLLAAPIAIAFLHKLRKQLLATGSATDFERLVVRLLDALLPKRPRNYFRYRRIPEIGLTERARHGRGPNSI